MSCESSARLDAGACIKESVDVARRADALPPQLVDGTSMGMTTVMGLRAAWS